MADDHANDCDMPSPTLGPVKVKKSYKRLDRGRPLQHQGFIEKKVVYAAHENSDDRESMAADDLGFGSGARGYVELSLNKKNRWNMVDDIRDNPEDYKGDFDRLRVLKGEWCPEQVDPYYVRKNPARLTSVREFTDDMKTLKTTKHTYGRYSTLTQKERPPMTRRERREQPWQPEPEPEESVVEYTVYSGCVRDGVRERDQRRLLSTGIHHDRRSLKFEKMAHGAPRLVEPEYDDDSPGGDTHFEDESDAETAAQYSRPPKEISLVGDDLLNWVPFKEVKQKKKKQRKPRVCSESEVQEGKGHVKYVGGSSESEGSNESFEILGVSQNLVRLSFTPTMPRVDVEIPKAAIEVDLLKSQFGPNHHECDSVPRAFSVDTTEQLQQALHTAYSEFQVRNIVTTSQINFLVKPRVGRCYDDGNSTLSVWLNCLVNDEVLSLEFNTIHVGKHFDNVPEIVNQGVKCLSLLPFESFTRATTAKEIPYLSAIRHFEPDAACVSKESVTEDLVSETFDQCLHRQLSKFERYMRQPSATAYIDFCGICYEEPTVDQPGLGLFACGHRFCEECWCNHLGQQVYAGTGRIMCPEFDCNTVVPLSFILLLLPQRVCAVYASQLRDTKVNAASKWMWCINPRCQRILHISAPSVTEGVIACGCGAKWCPHCQRDPHWPTDCRVFDGYNKQMESAGDNLTLAERRSKISFVNIKKCPHCSTPMEKGFGCQHIHCTCGRGFCWNCLGAWHSDGYGAHEKCARMNSSRGFEERFLIDVMTEGQILSNKAYKRCILHRHAREGHRLKALKRSLLKDLAVNDAVIDKLSSFAILDRIPTSSSTNLPSRDQLITFLLHYYSQCHYLLEFVNVWLALNRKHRVHSLVKSTVDTVAFFVGRFEECGLDGSTSKMIDTLGHIESSAQNLLSILSPVSSGLRPSTSKA